MTPTQLFLLAKSHPDISASFIEWIKDNYSVWEKFEDEALKVARRGRDHYSAYTIREYIRHETALKEANSDFKINNNYTPYLARLFALAHPEHAGLFSFRSVNEEAA